MQTVDLIRIAYKLRLRRAWSYFMRMVRGETQRANFPTFLKTPEDLEEYLGAYFEYRKDPLNGALDYVSHPNHTQWKLNRMDIADGDCDDIHFWAAYILNVMPGVEEAYFLSSGYPSDAFFSGHCTVVYKRCSNWWHFDYKNRPLHDPNDAPDIVAKRYGQNGELVAPWYVWEKVNPWRLVVISPGKVAK